MIYRNYDSIKAEALQARKSKDSNDWSMGDLCNELEDLGAHLRGEIEKNPGLSLTDEETLLSSGSRILLERLADDINVPKKSLFIRAKISRRVPKTGSPLSWVRTSSLSYACIREIYAVPEDEDFNKLAKKAVTQNMSVRELRTEMESYRDKRNIEAGLYTCKTCSELIKDPANLISVRSVVGTIPFCSWACVGDYAEKRMESSGLTNFPIEEVSTEELELDLVGV